MKLKIIVLCLGLSVSPTIFGMSLKEMLREAAKNQAEKNNKQEVQEVQELQELQDAVPTSNERENNQDSLFSDTVSKEKKTELWRDPNTGLTWRMCRVGEKFEDDTGYCDSALVKSLTWTEMILFVDELKLAGHDDWRVPTQKEFSSLYTKDNAKRFDELGYSNIWTSTSSDKLEDEVVIVSYNQGNGGEFKNVSKSREIKASAYIVREGVSDGTFENMVNVAKLDLIKRQKKAQQLASAELQVQEKMALKAEKERQAYYAKAVVFRKNIKVGDYTEQGLVVDIKGALVKIQQYGKQCVEYSSHLNSYNKNYDCLKMQKVVTGEVWMKRDEILPVR